MLLVLLIRVDWLIKNFHDVALNQQIIYPFTLFCLLNVGPSAISSQALVARVVDVVLNLCDSKSNETERSVFPSIEQPFHV